MNMNRRDLVAAALITGVSGSSIFRVVNSLVARPLEKQRSVETLRPTQELLRDLLKIHEGPLSVSFGPVLPYGNFHPDNIAGGTSIYAGMTGKEYEHRVARADQEMSLDSSGNLLMAGGPVGTLESRIAFEFDGPNSTSLVRSNKPIIPLRWYGLANQHDPRVAEQRKLFYVMENGELRETFNWPLVDTSGPNKYITVKPGARATETADWPENNFVTVTRMPNFLSDKADDLIRTGAPLSDWPHFVMLDGRNGLGTRGAALLASPAGRSALAEAANRISGFGPSYQVVFRLTNLEKGQHSEFAQIEYFDADIIPIKADILGRARIYAKARLNAITREI